MTKMVYLENNIVHSFVELPSGGPDITNPNRKWTWEESFTKEFLANCKSCSDDVKQGWVYDPIKKIFGEPPEPEIIERPMDILEFQEVLNILVGGKDDELDSIIG